MSVEGEAISARRTPRGSHRLLVLAAAALAIGASQSACTVDAVGVPTVDLEVRWTVDGSTSIAPCAEFGIDRWEVEVNGPELRAVSVACEDRWTTGNELLFLTEGSYTIVLRAIGLGQAELARIVTDQDLFDDVGFVDVVEFDVDSAEL